MLTTQELYTKQVALRSKKEAVLKQMQSAKDTLVTAEFVRDDFAQKRLIEVETLDKDEKAKFGSTVEARKHSIRKENETLWFQAEQAEATVKNLSLELSLVDNDLAGLYFFLNLLAIDNKVNLA